MNLSEFKSMMQFYDVLGADGHTPVRDLDWFEWRFEARFRRVTAVLGPAKTYTTVASPGWTPLGQDL